MLAFARNLPTRYKSSLLKGNQKTFFPIPASNGTIRNFWGFNKNDDNNDDDQKKKPGDKNNIDNVEDFGEVGEELSVKGKSKDITPTYGHFSPRVNPLLVLPVRRPCFPGYMAMTLVKNQALVDHILNAPKPFYFGLFTRKESGEGDSINNLDEVHKTGTLALLDTVFRLGGDGAGLQISFLAQRRIDLKEINNVGPPTIAEVKHWKRPDTASVSQQVKALTNEVISIFKEVMTLDPNLSEFKKHTPYYFPTDAEDPYSIADQATFLLRTTDVKQLQLLLEEPNIEKRLETLYRLLVQEKEILKAQKEIARQVHESLDKAQREYFLREQLKVIKKQLGIEKDDKEELLTKYVEKLKEIEVRSPKEGALKVMKEEMKKLESLEKNSPEFNVTRSYLDWLFSIPWGQTTQDILHLEKAKTILDEDHYGLDEIKTRILEFIAVGKLRGSVTGKIICFIGPPGVGKTSIGKSIARALDRKFYRFSVGGLTDTAEIKGHRRTYIGAMPGKPIQCLKHTKSMNPLILIDEIDKLGKSYNGDPASALLELLDPNQNSSFVDHYLDVPVDFSNVLFVCTANDESTIPGPLKDRMEVIRLSGYDTQEKVAIASRYLVPKALKEAGLVKEKAHASEENEPKKDEIKANANEQNVDPDAEKDKVAEKVSDVNTEPIGPKYVIGDEALEQLIKKYCRESGVRSLEKTIDKIARKLAFERVGALEKKKEDSQKSQGEVAVITPEDAKDEVHEVVTINKEDLEKYIGKPVFHDDTIYEDSHHGLPVGVVLGLAWNPFGGSPIFIETVAVACAPTERDTGVHMVTGQLGDVMKESVKIAYTYARRFLLQREPENKFFNSHQIHLHVPEGAISKDGPSAGIAMATSFVR